MIRKLKIFSLPRRIFKRIVIYFLRRNHLVIVSYSDPERRSVINLIHKIKRETEMIQSDNEAYQIFMAVKRTEKVDGDIAEVGTYKGGSAKLICETKGNKSLHLFDTFEGIPKVDQIDKPYYYTGKYTSSLENIKKYLKIYGNVYFYKGVFPVSAKPVENKNFSFVHLDVDTYESTLDCLQFFYPRICKGGVLISHDYTDMSPGVRKAFDEFFSDKPEPIIELSGSQCLIVKL